MKVFSVRLDEETYKKLVELAKTENRSVNAQIKQLIQKVK